MNLATHQFTEEALLIPPHKNQKTDLKMPLNGIILERIYLALGTIGTMTFNDGTKFCTLERPWADNQRRISCIPEGIYKMRQRYSPLITKLTGGDYELAWEVCDVKGRDYILVHPGNYISDSEGCILVGEASDFQGDEPVVWNSRKAFDRFMDKMSERDVWQIMVKENKGE